MDTLKLLVESNYIDNTFYNWLTENGYNEAPASTKYHGAHKGGLLDHCESVTCRLLDLTKGMNLTWQNERSPYIIGMFHDLCKIDNYIQDTEEHTVCGGESYSVAVDTYHYNENVLIKGHGEKSVILLSQFMKLTEEEILCIRYHMGAYEKEDWKQFDLAIKKYPTVLYTHTADMLASKLEV